MDQVVHRIVKRKLNENAFLKKLGEDSGREMAERLNRPEEDEPEEVRAQIRELKAALLSLSELQRKSRAKEFFSPDAVNPINEMLMRYKWVTQYVPTGAPGYMVVYPQSQPAHDLPPSISVDDPGLALWKSRLELPRLAGAIVGLATVGLLDRVRRCGYCQCQTWFFAKNERRFFCSSQHQQLAHKSTPEFKAKARAWQNRYYRNILSPVTGRERKKRNRKRGK